MTLLLQYPLFLLSLVLVAACGDESPPPTVAPVDVGWASFDSGGQFSLRESRALDFQPGPGRPELRLVPDLRVRSFSETVSGAWGIFDFQREDETEAVLVPTGALQEADRVATVGFASVGGATGTLEVTSRSATQTGFRFVADSEAVTSIVLPFRCDEEGSFHGFGEQYDATSHRGEAFELVVSEQGIDRTGTFRQITGDAHTTYFPMPFWLDARGFGVLFETDRRVRVDLCATDPEVATFEVMTDREVSFVVFHGPTPLDVIEQLGDVVGRPPALPDWAFDGVWVAAQGGSEVVAADLAAILEAELPVSALWVQDWTGIRRNIGGGFGVQYRWEADETLYPDLAGFIAELHARDIRFLAYANPFVDPALPNHFAEMSEAGLLMQRADGEPYVFNAPNGMAAHPDLTDPEARAYVTAALRAMVDDYGIDGWMHDFGEWTPFDATLASGRDAAGYHNVFPVAWQEVGLEALTQARPDGDFAFWVRSGWTGSQAVSQLHWAGDQEATFSETDGLPTVVPALLSLGLAGQPHVTHDIAGFSGGPSGKELYQRWTELGAFTPVMRTHEGNERDDNWNWNSDAETIAHFRRFARVHRALAPTFQALSEQARLTSRPILRHLMLAYPQDRTAWEVHDEFLIGEDLLVAPVVTEGATSRNVYLPAGTWFHVWTGESFEGPRTVDVEAPIGSPPVFSLGEDRRELREVQ